MIYIRKDETVEAVDAFTDGDDPGIQDAYIGIMGCTPGRFIGLDGKLYGIKERYDELSGRINAAPTVSFNITSAGRGQILEAGEVVSFLVVRNIGANPGTFTLLNADAVPGAGNVIFEEDILAGAYSTALVNMKMMGPVWAFDSGAGGAAFRVATQSWNR